MSPYDPLIPQVTPTVVEAKRGKQRDSINKIGTESITFTGAHQSSEQGPDDARKKISSTSPNNDFLKITKKMKTEKFGMSSVSFSCENSKHEIGSGRNSGVFYGKSYELFGTKCTEDDTVNEEIKSRAMKSFILPSTTLLWQWILLLKGIPKKNQRKKFPINSPDNYPDIKNAHRDEPSIEECHSCNQNSNHTGMTIDMKNISMITKTKMNLRRESSPRALGCHWWNGTSDTDTAEDANESDSDFDSLQYGRGNTHFKVKPRL
jgi:hypothetical protein